jgi:hypothetical protein
MPMLAEPVTALTPVLELEPELWNSKVHASEK